MWFENAGIGYIIIQDGSRRPRIYDGRYCRLSERVGGIPVGTLMRFANGRLHLVSTGSRRSLKLGDILEQGDPSTALKFTETGYFLGGGDFQFPSEITALIDIPRLDTTTGQGSMLIGTKDNLYSLRTEITDRDAWGQNPRLPDPRTANWRCGTWRDYSGEHGRIFSFPGWATLCTARRD